MDNLTEIERKVIKMLFIIADTILQTQDDYMNINYENFSRDDLIDLADKIGIKDWRW